MEFLHPAMWHDHDIDFVVWRCLTTRPFLLVVAATKFAYIMPGDCNLQCGMWLWNRDSEFTKWQHPAM